MFMKLSNFIDGILILQSYYKTDGYSIGAEHDTFYAYATDLPVSPEDYIKLTGLGWSQVDAPDGEYDPGDGWMAYT